MIEYFTFACTKTHPAESLKEIGYYGCNSEKIPEGVLHYMRNINGYKPPIVMLVFENSMCGETVYVCGDSARKLKAVFHGEAKVTESVFVIKSNEFIVA